MEDLVLSSPGRGTAPSGYSSAVIQGATPILTFLFAGRWFADADRRRSPSVPDLHLAMSQPVVLPDAMIGTRVVSQPPPHGQLGATTHD